MGTGPHWDHEWREAEVELDILVTAKEEDRGGNDGRAQPTSCGSPKDPTMRSRPGDPTARSLHAAWP